MAKVVCVLSRRSRRRLPRDLPARWAAAPRALPGRPDRCPPRAPSTSRRARCWAACPASSGFVGSWRTLGHELVVTSDKDGENSEFDRHFADAEVVISQPFWPAYLTAERIEQAPNLKLALTAGIGSDHVDLDAAIEHGITVAEVTYCNSISVAEHVVMMILSLVRNYLPSNQWVTDGGWNIADCVAALLRPRGHGRRHRRRGPDRARGAAPARPVRRAPALLRQAPAARRGRGRAQPDLPRVRRGDGAAPRRGDHQRAAAPRDARPVRRRADRHDETRCLPDQHRAGLIADRDAIVRALRAVSWRVTPATSGTPSPPRPTTRGARCPTTA